MPIYLAKEIWSELKPYINTVDLPDVSETFVSILIDNDNDPEDIKSVFKNDSEVKRALSHYLKDNHDDDDDDEPDDETDFEDDYEQ